MSVVLIFLNQERFIEEAVQSVRSQTLTNWELILVDDGSTDRSTTIARGLAAKDERIHYIDHVRHENQGMSASRNLGVAHATSPYLAFLDADDVWVSCKLAEQVELLDSNPEVAMVYGAMLYWRSWNPSASRLDNLVLTAGLADRRLDPPEGALAVKPLGCGPTGGMDVLVRRSAFDAVGGFEERFRGLFEDQAFFLKVSLRFPIYISSRNWLLYRQHGGSYNAQIKPREYWRQRGIFLDWLEEDDQRIADSRVEAAFRRARRQFIYRRLAAPLQEVFLRLPEKYRERVKRALGIASQ
ncbi:glycosyltransferase family A protein [Mycobacterium sp. 3519A]|uniref:glycosyltransferase family 2 protein n=1 Tax=Mycobacterium sp. 3519A TaxID=2057184 RepID=UPI001359D929|nr:glycosyltransferase family A protein [Mycobacterium sp. 3519A]